MKISEIMNQKVERADPTLPISKAAEKMRNLDIGFLPNIKTIMAALPADRQTIFCSATSESSVAHLINQSLREKKPLEWDAERQTARRSA